MADFPSIRSSLILRWTRPLQYAYIRFEVGICTCRLLWNARSRPHHHLARQQPQLSQGILLVLLDRPVLFPGLWEACGEVLPRPSFSLCQAKQTFLFLHSCRHPLHRPISITNLLIHRQMIHLCEPWCRVQYFFGVQSSQCGLWGILWLCRIQSNVIVRPTHPHHVSFAVLQ